MDLNTICRLCAESNCTLHPIFASNFENNNVAQKIQACASINILIDDGLPGMICSLCNDKLNAAYDFRLQIISTDEKLRLHVSTPQLPSVKRDPDEWENEPENNDIIPPFCEIKTDYSYDEIDEDKNSLHENLDIEKLGSDESDNDYTQDNTQESNNEEGTEENVDGTDEIKTLIRPFQKYQSKDKRSNPVYATICPKCGKLLKRNSFSDHMLNVHGQEATIECNICGKMVKTRRQLWHHKRTHEKESVNCDQCGKVFTTKAGFKRHYDDIHLGIRKYNCKLCEKSFPRVMALKRHMRSHTGERPYVCPYCNRGFGGRWNLKQHIRLHTKEKPYKCQFCSEAFTQNVMLKLHVKNKHTENTTENKDIDNQAPSNT